MASQSELWDWWHHVSKVDYGIDVLIFQNELWDLWHHSVEVDCGIDNIYTIVLRLYNFRLDSIMLLCWIVGSMTSRCWSGLWDWQHRHHCAEAYLFTNWQFHALVVNCEIDDNHVGEEDWGIYVICCTGELWDWWHHAVKLDCGIDTIMLRLHQFRIDSVTILWWIVGLTSSHCWGGLNSHKGVMIGKWSMWHHLDNKVDVSKVNWTAGWIYMHSDDIRLQLTVIKKESIKTRHRSLATGRIL